jgi:hypothetical protein
MKKHTSLKTQILCSILILSVLNACSSNAKIVKSDNTNVSGKIMRSDAQNVYLEQFGREVTVKRTEILDVSHPGKPLMWIGGGSFVGGATVAIVGALVKSNSSTATASSSGYSVTASNSSTLDTLGTVYIVGGSIVGVAGIVLFFTGYSKYSTSKDNLQADGGMTFWSPAPGVYLGYQPMVQMPIFASSGSETIHQGRLSFRF